MKKQARRPRVLVAKVGLDGHSRGVYVVAHGLREAGMEVIYTGIRQTPSSVARTAIQEAVDVIGISSMVGAHLPLVKKLRKELKALKGQDIPVIIGGIIPEEDYDPLRALGVSKVFPPGSEVKEIASYIRSVLEGSTWVPEVPGSLTGRDIEELHLLGSKCEKCGQVYFPSRRNCPRCMDECSIRQAQLSDRGTLQTFVIASMAPPGFDPPHAQGYIDLYEDGPRIFSILTDYGNGSRLTVGCKMGLKIIRRGKDQHNRAIMGYRFRPLP